MELGEINIKLIDRIILLWHYYNMNKKPINKIILLILLFSGIVFVLVTFNPLFNIFSFSFLLDKDLAMTYGTLIGGLLGPILSLLGFYLVYITFKEQKRFNDIQIV